MNLLEPKRAQHRAYARALVESLLSKQLAVLPALPAMPQAVQDDVPLQAIAERLHRGQLPEALRLLGYTDEIVVVADAAPDLVPDAVDAVGEVPKAADLLVESRSLCGYFALVVAMQTMLSFIAARYITPVFDMLANTLNVPTITTTSYQFGMTWGPLLVVILAALAVSGPFSTAVFRGVEQQLRHARFLLVKALLDGVADPRPLSRGPLSGLDPWSHATYEERSETARRTAEHRARQWARWILLIGVPALAIYTYYWASPFYSVLTQLSLSPVLHG